jgi:hypothetical protein
MNSGKTLSPEQAMQQLQVAQKRATTLSEVVREQRNAACDENASLMMEHKLLREAYDELRKLLDEKSKAIVQQEELIANLQKTNVRNQEEIAALKREDAMNDSLIKSLREDVAKLQAPKARTRKSAS